MNSVGVNSVGAIVPVVRGPFEVLPVLYSLVNQTRPPARTLLIDGSPEGLWRDPAFAWLTEWAGAQIVRAPGLDTATARAVASRMIADAEWLLFLDDDVLLWHTSIEELLDAAYRYDAVAVGGTKLDLVPQRLPWEVLHMTQNVAPRPFDIDAAALDGGLLMVRRTAWEQLDPSYANVPLVTTGEDILASAQLAMTGRMVVASRALGLHLRRTRPFWLNDYSTPERMWEAMGALMGERFVEEYQRRLNVEYNRAVKVDYPAGLWPGDKAQGGLQE